MMFSSRVDKKRDQLMRQQGTISVWNKSPQEDDPTWSYSNLYDKIPHLWISEASKNLNDLCVISTFGIQHLSAPSPPVAHP